MPLFGAHMSIAGGFHKALLAAQAHGCPVVQLFLGSPKVWPVKPVRAGQAVVQGGNFLTKSPSQWQAKPLTDDDADLFRRTRQEAGVRAAIGHDAYLINLASPDDELHRRSVESLIDELTRAERLGLDYLVVHPGAHVDSGEEAGLTRVAKALDEVHARCRGFRVQVLLENTAGQGSTLGHTFEHLAAILDRVADPDRLGVCFDTCHAFAAGYALSPAAKYRATFAHLDRVVGLDRLRVFHVNDSLKPRGSRVDRHAHIGAGELGLEPFRLLVNDARFAGHPMILETPKEDGDRADMDEVNLGALRRLIAP
jgi:deoxyribonuclease-4